MTVKEGQIALASGDPANWTATELGGKQALLRELSAEEKAAMAAAGAGQDIDHGPLVENPVLDRLAAEVRTILTEGRGIVILSNLDPAELGETGFRNAYWQLGRRIGQPAVQSERMEWVGLVRQEKDNPYARGFIQNIELPPHTDVHDLMSLACVSRASRGGESKFASALAIHDLLAREHPEMLRALYRGYPTGIPANYGVENAQVEADEDNVPVFCRVDGKVSIFIHGHYMLQYAKANDTQIPQDLADAMDEMTAISERPEIMLKLMLEPGEMVFWNNRTVLHGRDEFENDPGHERCLMRLWLHAPDARPLDPQIARQPVLMDEVHRLVHERDFA